MAAIEALDPSDLRRFPPYPSYWDTRIEWLGQIPQGWKLTRLKFQVAMNAEMLPESTRRDWLLRYIDISSVDERGAIGGLQTLEFGEAPSRARRVLRRNDTILSTVRTYLKAVALVEEDAQDLVASTGFAVLRPTQQLEPRFLWRLAQSEAFVQAVVAHSEGVSYPAIAPDELGSLPIWLPPLSEQRLIAGFLDRETAKIDAVLAKKQRLIDLLLEKRAALITYSVTKGLDPNVATKHSGIEWLGDVPSHWDVKPIRRLCSVRRGASPRPIDDPVYFDPDGEYAWVRISDVTASDRYLESTASRLSELGRSKSVTIAPGDLFISIAATVGKPIITKIKCCIHDGFVYFVGLKENREFLYYLFASLEFRHFSWLSTDRL